MTTSRQVDLAWAAGIFEGEGSVTPRCGAGNAHRHQAAVIMTDQDVLWRFAVIVGIGKFYGPYQPTNPKAKPIWRWMTTKNAEVEQLYDLIGGWMGQRRRKRFEEAIADNRAHPAPTTPYYHKLSHALHCEIRRRYRQGGISQRALGEEFGITQPTVSAIVRRPSIDQPACR